MDWIFPFSTPEEVLAQRSISVFCQWLLITQCYGYVKVSAFQFCLSHSYSHFSFVLCSSSFLLQRCLHMLNTDVMLITAPFWKNLFCPCQESNCHWSLSERTLILHRICFILLVTPLLLCSFKTADLMKSSVNLHSSCQESIGVFQKILTSSFHVQVCLVDLSLFSTCSNIWYMYMLGLEKGVEVYEGSDYVFSCLKVALETTEVFFTRMHGDRTRGHKLFRGSSV